MPGVTRRLEANELGDLELPEWAIHSAYSSVEYKCPGGVPEGELRDNMYGFLALVCAELLTDDSSGVFFLEEQVAIRNGPRLRDRFRSGIPLNPHTLAAQLSAQKPPVTGSMSNNAMLRQLSRLAKFPHSSLRSFLQGRENAFPWS